MKMEYCAISDKGLVREKNEDNLLMLPDANVFVVADGMGGHKGGEIASKLTVDTIRDYYRGMVNTNNKTSGIESLKESLGVLTKGEAQLWQAIEKANTAVYEVGLVLDPARGVGTTIVAGYVHGKTLYVLYSGDSRLYRIRKGRMKQITEDHSLLNQYLKEKKITLREAEFFPYRNVIMQALGLSPNCNAESRRTKIQPGDTYIFCTDGLTDMVNDKEIHTLIDTPGPLDDKCRALVDAALANGGMDNITVLLLRFSED